MGKWIFDDDQYLSQSCARIEATNHIRDLAASGRILRPNTRVTQDDFGAHSIGFLELHPFQGSNGNTRHDPVFVDSNESRQVIARRDLRANVNGATKDLGVEWCHNLGPFEIEFCLFDRGFCCFDLCSD